MNNGGFEKCVMIYVGTKKIHEKNLKAILVYMPSAIISITNYYTPNWVFNVLKLVQFLTMFFCQKMPIMTGIITAKKMDSNVVVGHLLVQKLLLNQPLFYRAFSFGKE